MTLRTPNEQQIIEAAEKAGLWPNTVRNWIPAFHRYHAEIAKTLAAPAQPVERQELSDAADAVLAERRRQIEREEYHPDGDDNYVSGEIAAYATFYAMPPAVRDWPATETGYGGTWGEAIIPPDWTAPKPGDRRRELVKAAALILAEIERIDRAADRGQV